MSGSTLGGSPAPAGPAPLARAGLMVATAVTLAALAPLRTAELAWLPRITLFLAAAAMWEAAFILTTRWLARRGPAPSFGMVLLVAAVPATTLTVALRAAAGETPGHLPRAFAESLLLGLLVSLARRGLRRMAPTPQPVLASTPTPDPARAFLCRHAPTLTGRLLALAAEDHYLRIHTETGSALVLLRLRDAVAELGPTVGWQPHRSFWLAADAGGHAVRRGQAWRIELPGGLAIPVSKAAAPAMRALGYIPAPNRSSNGAEPPPGR